MTTETKRSTYFNALELEVLMLAYGEYEHIFRRRCNTAAAVKERETHGRTLLPESTRGKRMWKQLKMKHKNIIQNANRKKAEARKTGGGPRPPPLTESEELALSQNRGRPVAEGIPGGSSSEPVTPQDTSAYIRCKHGQDDLLQFKPSIRMGKKVPIEHRVKATDYLSIVADHVHPFMTTVYPSSDGYFQQDNAPCHKARIISDWFLEHDNEFTVLKWPPQSPDLNPIEHLWDVVEREIRIMDVQPTNLQQLRDAIMSIWTKLSEECFQYLVESVPRRIKAVLKAKGGPTRY
ncbi:Transposable element Tcb2 transposase [Merluccius polli]|uniref:Transposable element Tcb2 transposase n=1 Tax=Merluccius polli TaxID=89951 RepID=A0AA47M4B3_MERPO|nr:Transposable element Tcb2 transposase [Merluccius polli]